MLCIGFRRLAVQTNSSITSCNSWDWRFFGILYPLPPALSSQVFILPSLSNPLLEPTRRRFPRSDEGALETRLGENLLRHGGPKPKDDGKTIATVFEKKTDGEFAGDETNRKIFRDRQRRQDDTRIRNQGSGRSAPGFCLSKSPTGRRFTRPGAALHTEQSHNSIGHISILPLASNPQSDR